MDLTQIVRENPRARKIILDLNPAEIVRKFGVTLKQAKQLQEYAALLDMVESD